MGDRTADPVQQLIDDIGDAIARAGEAGAGPIDVAGALARILGLSISTAAPSAAAAGGMLSGAFAIMLDTIGRDRAAAPAGVTLQ